MTEHEHDHHVHLSEHGENCSCGLHDHDHTHSHDHHEHAHGGKTHTEDQANVVYVETHLHDEARVISGRLTISCSYDTVREALADRLGQLAREISARGGIVGHIKASCNVRTVEMFSVTDADASVAVKRAPEQEIGIIFAAIVFLIEPAEAEKLAAEALAAIRDGTGA